MNHSSKKAVTMTEIALMLQMVQMETLLAAASKGEIFEEIKWKLMPRNLRYPRQYLPARTTLTNKLKGSFRSHSTCQSGGKPARM